MVSALAIHNSTLSKRGVHADKFQCKNGKSRSFARTQWNADTVERAHTKSLDANDKLIQTRSHVRDTIASRKRQVIMRKGKSTIVRTSNYRVITACDLYCCLLPQREALRTCRSGFPIAIVALLGLFCGLRSHLASGEFCPPRCAHVCAITTPLHSLYQGSPNYGPPSEAISPGRKTHFANNDK